MRKMLCCISASIITALSANTCMAASNNGLSSLLANSGSAEPHLRISSGLMDNPTKPLAMTVQNMSDETIHLNQLSLSNGAAMQGWKLSQDACSHHTLLPQQSCTYSIASSSNQAGGRATVTLSAAEVSTPILKDIVIPYPKLKVADAGNRAAVTLNDNDTKVITITNPSPYIAVPGVGYHLGNSKFASGQLSISNSCGKLLGPSASCALNIKTAKIVPESAGRQSRLDITARGNNVLSRLNVALNDPEQLQFSVAPRQYPAFEDIVVTNTNADSAKIKFIRMPQGTDISFKDHPGTTDPDSTPVCKYNLQLTTNQQCHIWLHAKTGALSLSPNNYQLKITYNVAGNNSVKEIDGNNRSVLYLGGTDGNGKPLLAAYNGFAYESFADLTNNTSPNVTFPDGDSVLALATDADGTLYFGGKFADIQNSQTQTETVLNNIGAWNGSDFVALNNNIRVGVDDTVRALSYDSGSNVLYLGGDFNDNSSLPMNYVASIKDATIKLFDPDDNAFKYVTSPVYALANDGGSNVFIGTGNLSQYSSNPNSVVKAEVDRNNPFDNTFEKQLSHGTIGATALDLYGSMLYAASNEHSFNIQYYRGPEWEPLLEETDYVPEPYIPDGSVYSILRMGGLIFVGGDFSSIEFNDYFYIPNTASFAILDDTHYYFQGKWLSNTSVKSSSGDPIVYSIIGDYTNRLVYIAGHFDSIDNGITADNLAIYDTVHNSFVGVSNSPFVNGAVKAMAIGSVVNVSNI